jgi:hypothetical protein
MALKYCSSDYQGVSNEWKEIKWYYKVQFWTWNSVNVNKVFTINGLSTSFWPLLTHDLNNLAESYLQDNWAENITLIVFTRVFPFGLCAHIQTWSRNHLNNLSYQFHGYLDQISSQGFSIFWLCDLVFHPMNSSVQFITYTNILNKFGGNRGKMSSLEC